MDSSNSWGSVNPSANEIWGSSGGGAGGSVTVGNASSAATNSAWNNISSTAGGGVRAASAISGASGSMWGKASNSVGSSGQPSGPSNESWVRPVTSENNGTGSWDTQVGERNEATISSGSGVAGWGSPSPSPAQNVGTEGWGSSKDPGGNGSGSWGAQKTGSSWSDSTSGLKDTRVAVNGLPELNNASSGAGVWGDTGGTSDQTKSSGWSGTGASTGTTAPAGTTAQGVWSRGNPINATSNHISTSAPQQIVSSSTTTTPPVVPSPSGSWAQAAGRGLPTNTATKSAEEAAAALAEFMSRAINSSDGWGKTVIRQDTAWAIDEPAPRPPETIAPTTEPPTPAQQQQLNLHTINGTAIWESSSSTASSIGGKSESSGFNPPPSTGGGGSGGAWSGTPLEKTQELAAMLNGPGAVPQTGFRPPLPTVTPSTAGSWPSQPADRVPSWGAADGLWDGSGSKKEEDSMWNSDGASRPSRPDSALGNWERPLHRSLSAGSWSSETDSACRVSAAWGADNKSVASGHHGSGVEVDDGTSCWGDPSGGSGGVQPWRGGADGDKSHMSQRDNSGAFFGVPPPTLDLKANNFGGGDHMEGLIGGWNPSVPPPKLSGGAGGWGDAGQWPPGAGPPRMKPPTVGSSSATWNNDSSADWMRRAGASFGVKPQTGVVNIGRGQQPQRSVVLQQLVDLGFKKEDAQNALIIHNMNVHNALADLMSQQHRGGAGHPDLDPNDLLKSPPLLKAGNHEDLSRLLAQGDVPPGGPGFGLGGPMLNTQFGGSSSAQTHQLQHNMPTLPSQLQQLSQQQQQLAAASSLANVSSNFSSINNPQLQKLLQLQQQQQQPSGPGLSLPPMGGPGGLPSPGGSTRPSGAAGPTVQQQQVMQQMLASVQGAVQIGLLPAHIITPAAMANANFVVNVQQLVRLYQMYTQLNAQARSAAASPGGAAQQQQIQDVASSVHQQLQQQRQALLAMAQGPGMNATSPLSMPPLPPHLSTSLPPPPTPGSGLQVDQLLKTLASLGSDDGSTSRLNQWKIPGGSDSGGEGGCIGGGDQDIGGGASKPTDNGLGAYTTGDTWGVSSTSSMLNSPSEKGKSSVAGGGSTVQTSTRSSSESSTSSSTGSTAGGNGGSAAAVAAAAAAAAAAALEIEEFIPGKLWQGPNTKNIEDDPYITPGSINDTSAVKSSNPSLSSSLSTLTSSAANAKSATLGGSAMSGAWSNDLTVPAGSDQWGKSPMPPSHIPPPGGAGRTMGMNRAPWPQQPQQQQNLNRSVSWTPGDRSDLSAMSNNWSNGPSSSATWIVLKNLSLRVDHTTIQTLCLQHGPISRFVPNSSRSQVLVGYVRAEDAGKAQRALNMCPLSGTQLIAEMVGGDMEAAQYLDVASGARAPMIRPPTGIGGNFPLPPPGNGGYHGGMMRSPMPPHMMGGGADWGNTGGWGTGAGGLGGNSWGSGGIGDHGSSFLPNDLLGGQ